MVSEEEFNEMEVKWREDPRSIPEECFVAKCADGEYLAMDNSSGECWVEKFAAKVLAEEFFDNNLMYDDTRYEGFSKIQNNYLGY